METIRVTRKVLRQEFYFQSFLGTHELYLSNEDTIEILSKLHLNQETCQTEPLLSTTRYTVLIRHSFYRIYISHSLSHTSCSSGMHLTRINPKLAIIDPISPFSVISFSLNRFEFRNDSKGLEISVAFGANLRELALIVDKTFDTCFASLWPEELSRHSIRIDLSKTGELGRRPFKYCKKASPLIQPLIWDKYGQLCIASGVPWIG